jgi:hypothetical protein
MIAAGAGPRPGSDGISAQFDSAVTRMGSVDVLIWNVDYGMVRLLTRDLL